MISEILNYQIIRLLGEGGMGQVYLAKNKNIDQFVAIKALHPRLANNFMLRQRFKQEAMLLSSLNHPNIVRFLNYIENEHGVFLIMEYVDGMTLQDYIDKKNGLIVEKRAYPLFEEILDAFTYAHKNNIVHLDIKPSNIFITGDGHIKVMDFGIAKILSESDSEANKQQMGTPEYMSPEQVLDRAIDLRSDIYSLGVLFHQMLTGRAPYDNTTLSLLEIKQHVINDRLPRMKAYYPYVSDGMQRVVDKATQKLPSSRFKDCTDMRNAMRAVLNPPGPDTRKWFFLAAAVLVLAVGGFFVWDYFRTKVIYYKDYVEVFGIPQGIGKLSSDEVSHRASSYRMEISRRKPRRLTLVNSADVPVRHNDSESSSLRNTDVEFFYTDGGQIDYKKVYDEFGRLLYKLDYDENLKTATFKYDDKYGTPMRLGANTTDTYSEQRNGEGQINRSNISKLLLEFDDSDGHLLQARYAGLNNEPVGDADNIYGMNYEYDNIGRISRITFLGADGKPRNNHSGLGYKTYKYDSDGNCNEMRFFSIDGTPSHDGNHCAVVSVEFDKWGNRVNERYYDANGKSTMRTDIGSFGASEEYDDNGFMIRQTNLGPDGKPMITGSGYAVVEITVDDRGRSTRMEYRDAKGNACNIIDDGEIYHVIEFMFNDRNQITQIDYLDLDGKKTTLSYGLSSITRDYDDDGYMTHERYYDSSGHAAKVNGYHSGIQLVYDDLHRETKRVFIDAQGKPTLTSDNMCGYATKYDVQGNIIEITYLGHDLKMVNNGDGVANIKYVYDDRGNNTSREFLTQDGTPVKRADSYSKIEVSYDPESNLPIESRYYDGSGLSKTILRSYDKAGNITKQYTTDNKGKLIGRVENRQYDSSNRVTREWATDLNGKRQNIHGTNLAETTFKYDERGNVIETEYFDVNGKPSTKDDGTHRVIREYDQLNRNTVYKLLDVNNKPIKFKNTSPETHFKHDERGNLIETTFYDGYGKPANGPYGAQRKVQEFNDRNQPILIAYYDLAGLPVEVDGYAKTELERDNHGNITREKFFNKTGSVSYQMLYKYNQHDQITEMSYTDANGKLKNTPYGYSRITVEYGDDQITPKSNVIYDCYGNTLASQRYNTTTQQWQ